MYKCYICGCYIKYGTFCKECDKKLEEEREERWKKMQRSRKKETIDKIEVKHERDN